jgi:hypothetical protein
MGKLSDYAQNLYLTHMLGGVGLSSQVAWVFLATAAVSQADTGATVSANVEVEGGNYARALTTIANWSVTTTGIASNAAAITFVSATASWSTITHFGLADASVAGNLLAFASVATAKAVSSDDIVSFAIGALDVSIS